jgi:hypothetical protein
MASPSPSTKRAATFRAAGGVGVLGLALALMGACCDGERCLEPPRDDAGPQVCAAGEGGPGCAYATPGCDADAIRKSGDEICASCTVDADDVEICGLPEIARCEAREDSKGDPCRICATAGGEILYDSCFSDVSPEIASCERSLLGPSPAEADDDDIVCETCTDLRGAVVSTVCEPVHDECHAVQDGDRACRECTRDGAVVIYACEQPNIEPRSCQVYGNERGRCIDCFGDEDQLLSHSCTLVGDVFVSCSEIVTQEGLRCSVCVDQNGAQVSRSCNQDIAELQQCALLDYTDQSCLVCLDQFGGVALTSCQRKGCVGDNCAAPPACFFENVGDALCRTCTVEGSGALEQRCVVETNLVCASGVSDGAAGSCLSCTDRVTGLEVYKRCDGTGSPPTCFTVDDADGGRCEVCNDPVSNETVYASCDGQTCYALGRYQLTGRLGTALRLDGSPAVAECAECARSADFSGASSFTASCSLRDDCGGTDLVDPGAACERAVLLQLAPRLCGNPWERAGYGSADGQAGAYELLVVLGYALEAGGIGLISLSTSVGEADAECAGGCDCPRGDRMDALVRAQDADAAARLFESIVVR